MVKRGQLKQLIFIVILVLSLIPSTLAEQVTEYNLTYDANGNLIQGINEYYEYNGFNQLDKVRENNVTGRILSEYSYDHEGNRLKKIKYNVDGTNETTYYIDKEFIQVVNSSGTYNFTYYYHEDTLIAEEDQLGNKLFYHPDHLGSTTLVTNESGEVVEEINYLPYGDLLINSNKRFLFTGKEKDNESGLYYYGVRYYSPFFSHFTQPDQNIPDIYNPQDLNRYSYVRNNPYKYVDPSGESPTVVTALIGAAVGAGIGVSFAVYQQYQATGSISNFGAIGKGAGIGAVAGGVAGLTLGVGTALLGGESLGSAIGLGAASSVAGGRSAQVAQNAISGAPLTQGLFDPGAIATEAAFGGIAGGVGYGIGSYLKTRIPSQKFSGLPSEAQQTMEQIEGGNSESLNPHVFENRPVDGKSLLPKNSDPKYYNAYDVRISGQSGRGTSRIVTGRGGESYYTSNHYKSFTRIRGGSR